MHPLKPVRSDPEPPRAPTIGVAPGSPRDSTRCCVPDGARAQLALSGNGGAGVVRFS
jgi:hypothetical protein